MGMWPWVGWAAVLVGTVGFGAWVIVLLREIVGELRQMRRDLQEVAAQIAKVSGPLDSVRKIYGIGENILHRSHEK